MCAIHRRFSSLVIGLLGIVTLVLGVGACLPIRAAGDGTTGMSVDPMIMPSLRGLVLSDGEDALRALGIENVSAVPVDGHMFVFNDNNWIVVRQTPDPGAVVAPDEEVTLDVEKTEAAESRFCFDGDC